MAPSISFCCLSGGPPVRTAALAALVRPAVDEVVVALDERIDPAELASLPELCDVLVRYPFAEPVERAFAWLHGLCRGDWILRLDDDEVPSAALLERLREVVAEPDLTHAHVPRRWLFPDASTSLADAPWTPDYQLRLARNDPAVVSFPGRVHVPIAAVGPAEWLAEPIYHLDLLTNDRAAREKKARRYERELPGLRVAGRALNEAYYLPESRPGAHRETVPADDRAAIEAVLGAEPADAEQVEVRTATREEIDAVWSRRPWPPGSYRAAVRVVGGGGPFVAGEVRTLAVELENLGDETWPWGGHGEPPVRLSYHWRRNGEPTVRGGLRTPLPRPLGPGGRLRVAAPVEAPAEPGRYELALDLVREHVRWFGSECALAIEVLPRRRVGVLAWRRPGEDPELDEAVAAALARLAETKPELEPLVLGEDPGALRARFGHDAAEGPRAFLLRGLEPGQRLRPLVLLPLRSARLRRRPFPEVEALVVVPLPPGAATRDLWALASTARAARAAGVTVVLTSRPSEPDGLDGRLVRRLVAAEGGDAPPGGRAAAV
jgi:hypothetical protein